MKKYQILIIVIAFIIFGVFIYWAGPLQILEQFNQLGYYFFIILIPYFFVLILDTIGWKHVIIVKEKKFRFIDILKIKLAGDFVNNVTPAGSIAGEPVKAHLLKLYKVSFVDGMASVYMCKLLMAKGQLFFILIGLIFAFSYFVGKDSQIILISGVIFIFFFGLVIGIFYYVGSKKGIFNLILSLLEKVRLNFSFIEKQREQLNLFDEKISHFYKNHKKKFLISIISFFCSWMIGAVELYIMLKLLGSNIMFPEAIVIESINSVFKGFTFFVPGGVGTQELTYLLLFSNFGISKETTMAFSIVKRIRELIWLGIGMILLSKFNLKLPKLDKEKRIKN